MKNKPDCYNCIFSRDIPGNAHKKCVHPKANLGDSPLLGIAALFGGGLPAKTGLKVKINPQGIRGGWAMHPLNFDPIWIDECEGYKPKKEEKNET